MSLPRHRVAVLGAAVALVVGATIAAAATAGGGDQGSATVPVEVGDRVDAFGIRLGMRTSFDDDVTLSAARVSVAGATRDVQLWPEDGVEHEGQDLDPLALHAGTPVSMDATVRPPCREEKNGPLMFQVRVRHADGRTELVRFLARDPDALLLPLEKWCSHGPWIGLSHTELSPDGRAIVHLSVSNPGPSTVHVEVPAYADEHATWRAAVPEDVAPGEMADIQIHGTDVVCADGKYGSWRRGRLLVDGEPTRVQWRGSC
jgi:hypothetical protein